MNELDDLSKIQKSQQIYLAPAGGAADRFRDYLFKIRPDIKVNYYLDSYRTGVLSDIQIKEIRDCEELDKNIMTIVVMERDSIREDINNKLVNNNFNDIWYVGVRLSFSMTDHKERKKEKDTLHFFYDLSVNSTNYEYLMSLCHANAVRKERGLKFLHPVIVPNYESSVFDMSRGSLKEENAPLEGDADWFVYNVISFTPLLLPSCDAISILSSRNEAGKFVECVSEHKFPEQYDPLHPLQLTSMSILMYTDIFGGRSFGRPLASSTASLLFVKQWLSAHEIDVSKLVVITTRDNKMDVERNFSKDAWLCFARKIKKMGYTPVFVKDTYSALENNVFDEFLVCHVASFNVAIRMALYEIALLNMTSSGATTLLLFNKAIRYLNFIYVSDYKTGKIEYFALAGSPYGSQYPASGPFQKWVWGGTDDCTVMLSEFNEMVSVIEKTPLA